MANIAEEQETYRSITAKEFEGLDFSQVTLVDLREPDELIVDSIAGALNIPFSGYAKRLDEIPKDRPVVVYCRVGDWSEQVAEILADRGYEPDTVNDRILVDYGIGSVRTLSDNKLSLLEEEGHGGEKCKQRNRLWDARCPHRHIIHSMISRWTIS